MGLQYADMQRRRSDWSLQQCLRSAIPMTNDILGKIDVNTVYRWKQRGKNDAEERPGTRSKFDSAAVVLLGQSFKTLMDNIPHRRSFPQDHWRPHSA
eukprot:283885-Amphidinium_carterae.1